MITSAYLFRDLTKKIFSCQTLIIWNKLDGILNEKSDTFRHRFTK